MDVANARSFIEYCCSELDKLDTLFQKEWTMRKPEDWMKVQHVGHWTPAENLAHLIRINESYFPIFDAIIEKRYTLSWFPFSKCLTGLTGRMILKSVSRDRLKRMKTFSIWIPESPQDPEEILKTYYRNHRELKTRITLLVSDLHSGTRIASPANPYVQYTLRDALKIIIEHEWRHYAQALEAFES